MNTEDILCQQAFMNIKAYFEDNGCEDVKEDLQILDNFFQRQLENDASWIEDFLQSDGVKTTSSLQISPLSLSVKMMDVKFNTIMHAFQAQKVQYSKNQFAYTEEQMKDCMKSFANVSLDDANRMGRSIALDVEKWNGDKVQIMEKLLRLAYNQHSHVPQSLAKVHGCTIFEDVIPDDFWGAGSSHSGKNTIGELWMHIRDY